MNIAAVLTAFAGGLFSFLSPCVLPLVPGYLSIISGYSLDQLKDDDKNASLKRTVVLNSLMFIIGFSLAFIALGASATAIGGFIFSRKEILYKIAGIVIIVFGLHVLGVFKIKSLYQDKRFHDVQKPRGAWGVLLFGFVFAFGWTPCIGPILAGILTLAGTQQTVMQGTLLLAVYSLGLAVPFLLTSLGLNHFLAFYGRFKRHFRTLEIVSGLMVVSIGVLILSGSLARLSSYFNFLTDFELWLESFLHKA